MQPEKTTTAKFSRFKTKDNFETMRCHTASLFVIVLLTSCLTSKKVAFKEGNQLTFVGSFVIPNHQTFSNTRVGGLSGIDYNAKEDVFYLVSDDRSDINPARFYTAKMSLSEKGIDSVWFVGVATLANKKGQLFSSHAKDALHSCDAEAIRYNAKTSELVWSSEGERFMKKDSVLLVDPWIYTMNKNGNFIDSFLLSANMHIQASQNGPRRNSVFEGLSFANNYRHLYASVEEPLFEDGPPAALNDSGAWTRIILFDVKTKKPLEQYAYRIDAVTSVPNPSTAFRMNGIVDVLDAGKNKLLVVERSYSTGVKKNSIRVYLAGFNKASDIGSNASLMKSSGFKPAWKQLVLNMDKLDIHTDNIEGVCYGPRLPNGKRSVIFVSDNNFNEAQVTQLLLFQIE